MKFGTRQAIAVGMLFVAVAGCYVLWSQGFTLKTVSIVAATGLYISVIVASGGRCCRRRRCNDDGSYVATWFGF